MSHSYNKALPMSVRVWKCYCLLVVSTTHKQQPPKSHQQRSSTIQSGIPHSHGMACKAASTKGGGTTNRRTNLTQSPTLISLDLGWSPAHGGEGRGRVLNMGVAICFATLPPPFAPYPPTYHPPAILAALPPAAPFPTLGGAVIAHSSPFHCRPLPLPGRRSARRSVQTRSSACGCSGSLTGAGGESAGGGSKDCGKNRGTDEGGGGYVPTLQRFGNAA